MKRLLAALLATTCLTAPTPACAEPITLAIAATVFGSTAAAATAGFAAGTIATAVATFALTAVASVGLSLAANALLQKPEQAADTPSGGADLSVQYGGALARSAIMGRGATGGHHVYTNVYGPTNEAMECVFVIGDGQHGKITALKYNGKDCTLPAGGLAPGAAYAVPEFVVLGTPCVGLTYYNGTYSQAADASLIAHANPPGRWTTDHRGAGVAYLYVHQIYAEGDVGLTGVPTLMIETEGLVLYDPRLDSTNGGSGPHRWGDPSTYAPSSNPAVQEYNFRRGVLVNGKRVLGMTMSPVNLILPMYIAAANINDELIGLAPDGTLKEPRYQCSIAASDDRTASDVLSAMRASTAGYSLERGGQFGPIPGVPQIPIASLAFTDDDMIVGAPARFTKYRSRSELVTATFGQFADPAQFWIPSAFPPRELASDDAALGERIAKSMDLTQVFSSSQAQRIAEIERRRTLQQGQGVATLPAKWIGVQPGDWLTYNSARHGNMVVLITGTSLDTARQQIAITYERISNSVYSWTPAGELFPPDVGDPGQPGTLIMIAAGMFATGVVLPGDGGLKTPGIQFTWTPILDPTVDQIDFEIRRLTDTQVLPFTADFPEAGSAVCSGHGIAASTVYEYRHKLYTVPQRDTPWSVWISVVSGAQHVVPSALTSAPLTEVTLAMFEAGLRDYVARELGDAFYWQDRAEQLIASVAAEQEAANWLEIHVDQKKVNTDIVRQISAVTGGYTYRGDYVATALYHANDMVRVANGKLYTTNADVQGVAPPTAPWAEQPNAAIIAQEWRNFSGPDGFAAATSDRIEARFQGVTVGTTPNDLPRGLADIIRDWAAFAGNDYSTAQTSDQIQANFYGAVTPGQPNLTKSVASVHSEWNTFAGPNYAGATTTVNIESRFGVDGPLGTLPISVATLAQRWNTFAGGAYAAAQTSQQIKAMFGHDATGTLPRSLANIISDWQAFAGADYAAASTSNKIEARFVGGTVGSGPDAASNDNLMSVASVTNKWFAFAGGDNAAAQTSAEIEARFTGAGQPGVGIPISLATLISRWDVFADATHSVSSSSDELVAAINGTSATIEGSQTATANINGKLSATWQVKVTSGNYVTGIQLYNDGTNENSFTVVSDNFRVARPASGAAGNPVTVFEINNVNSTAKIVFRGDMFADGTITARAVTTGELITVAAQIKDGTIETAKIGNLQVGTLKIATGAVTQCGINANGNGVTPSVTFTEILRTAVTVVGTGGEQITLIVSGGMDQQTVGDVPAQSAVLEWYVELIESGAQFDGGINWSSSSVRVTLSGGVKFTASAVGNTLTARIMARRYSVGFSSSTLLNRRITLTAFVK